MNEIDRRKAICRACPDFEHVQGWYWCEARDNNFEAVYNCPKTRFARWQARLCNPQPSCPHWWCREEAFARIYRSHFWGGPTPSGPGSSLEATASLRQTLPAVLRELGCRSLLDVGCGDFSWLSRADLAGIDYTGLEIVPELVEANRERYPGQTFLRGDAVSAPLPRADAVLLRAVLTHLPDADCRRVLQAIRASGAQYLFATTYPEADRHGEIVAGEFRETNLQRAPFWLGPPVRVLQDHETQCIGVWRLTCPACSLVDPLPDPEQQPLPRGWRNDPAVKARHVAGLAEMMGRRFDPPTDHHGDGVLICGEGRYWPGIVVAVRLLRDVGCRLPVQVWHNGRVGDELEDDPLVHTIDAALYRQAHPARILRGWEIKTYALLHCGFRRVLYLDADAYCVADPARLFDVLDAAPFAYWEDLRNCWNSVHWPWYGVDGQTIPPVQGGQLLIDVPGFWRELILANWINQHSDYFYGHQFGDQDSWRVVLTTGQTALNLGQAQWRRLAFVCEHPAGRPMIVHRCRAKLIAGRQPQRFDGLPLERRVHEIFASVCAGMGLDLPPRVLTRRELAHKARGRVVA